MYHIQSHQQRYAQSAFLYCCLLNGVNLFSARKVQDGTQLSVLEQMT